jgi:hypothetical protein
MDAYPTGVGTGGNGAYHICADDTFTLYIDGKPPKVGGVDTPVQGANSQDTQAGTFGSYDCNSPTVFAIEATNTGGPGGIIADITHCGAEIATIPARIAAGLCRHFLAGCPFAPGVTHNYMK